MVPQDCEWLERLSIAHWWHSDTCCGQSSSRNIGERHEESKRKEMLWSWSVTAEVKISIYQSATSRPIRSFFLRMTDWDSRLIWAGALQAALPFMRSRMKQSLSGVWKAYVIHTMKGQSCREGDLGLEQRGFSGLLLSAAIFYCLWPRNLYPIYFIDPA